MPRAAFELIDMPKDSGPVRIGTTVKMVVDAMDLCGSKGHIDTFVLASGEGELLPLVTKLGENGKTVIGIAAGKASTAGLADHMDELLDYTDLS